MNVQHVNIKFFVDGELTVELDKVIELFHRWTAEQIRDELLIDVADYRHVPAGPSVALIGHEADYVLDNTGYRYGLRYNRKTALDGSNEHRMLQAVRSALQACELLEAEFATLRFNRREFEITVNDRALAPNTEETRVAFEPILRSFIGEHLQQSDFTVDYQRDERSLFGALVSLPKMVNVQEPV
ncbi:MAG: hypothetical protein MK102_02930 [Fuerstiella sp.]|nr:hypothetical protein [Fuerstiella sp.]